MNEIKQAEKEILFYHRKIKRGCFFKTTSKDLTRIENFFINMYLKIVII